MIISDLFETTSGRDFGARIFHASFRLEAGIHQQITRSKPKSTYYPVHYTISELSKEKLGIDVRSLMFASTAKRNAYPYGHLYELLPLGNYRVFVADGVTDMTMTYQFLHQSYEDAVYDILEEYLESLSYELKDQVESFLLDLDMHPSKITIKETHDKLVDIITSQLKKEGNQVPQSEVESMLMQIKKLFERIGEDINDYVGRLKEVKHVRDINDKQSELMLYLPDGFQLIDAEGEKDK